MHYKTESQANYVIEKQGLLFWKPQVWYFYHHHLGIFGARNDEK